MVVVFNLKIIRNVSRRVGDLSSAGSAARGISRRAARCGGGGVTPAEA